MPAYPVVLIDTSVFMNLIAVPGRCDRKEEMQREFKALMKRDARFILPVTTIIETGNHIAQAGGDRRGAAQRLENAIKAAKADDPPWTIRDVRWGDDFLSSLLQGDSTGISMVDHLTRSTLGTGDIAILVERDGFKARAAFEDVRVWTLDNALSSYG